jgi:capsular polysaccharide transport system permease protein
MFRFVIHHSRMVGALLMREIVTRFGREGLGFLWLIGEPLMFCLGVMGLWTLLKPEYEHGIRVAPFVMTGYISILLFRHTVSHAQDAVAANTGLLYHRHVKMYHIFLSRGIMELCGAALAHFVVYMMLIVLGFVSPPSDYILFYSAHLILSLISLGFGITFASLSMRYEVLERILPVSMYLMVPLSGAFIMVDWLPQKYQALYLLNPLPHTVEMIRHAVFGEFVHTHYNISYAIAWGVGLNFVGLIMLIRNQRYLDIE